MAKARVTVGARGRNVWLALAGVLAALVGSGVRLAAEPSATPRLDWLFDGIVHATARVGNTLYVGGDFKSVVPSSGAVGNFFALSPASGAVVPTNIQTLDIVPSKIEADGAGGYFISGAANGATTGKVVHTRADGTVDPAFQSPPGSFAAVGRMVRAGSMLVIGGFLQVNGASRAIVALDAATGALLPWAPVLPASDSAVWDVVADGGNVIVVSGQFFGATRYVTAFDAATAAQVWQADVTGAPGFSGGGVLRKVGGRLIAGIGRLYALDPSTGAVDTAWAAGQVATGTVLAMAASGQTIYVGGTFTAFHGQPRAHLAAVDAATGALLPWSPQASAIVSAMTVSPTGTVFVGARESASTINGVVRGVFEIDATGAVTSFTSQAVIEKVTLLQISQSGSLFVGGSPGFIGKVSRFKLAAFDLTSGALLPETPLLGGGASTTVFQLAAAGQTLYLLGSFDAVNGQARAGVGAVDVLSGTVLPWPAPGVTVLELGAIDGTAMYGVVRTAAGGGYLRRVHTTTGAVDPTWTPTEGLFVVPDRGELLTVTPLVSPNGNFAVGSRVGVLDAVTGEFREWLRTPEGSYIARLIPDGGTVYLQGTDSTTVYGTFDTGQTVYAIDRALRVPVARPPLTGRIIAAALVDGRFLVGGRNIAVGATERYGAVETTRTGALTGWDPGFAPYGPATGPGGAPGGVGAIVAHGNALVVTGVVGSALSRVAVFDLSGSAAPSGLRSRTAAGVVEFTWDPPATPPAGGYVLEGGFAPGQTAAAIGVGTSTTFATPVSVLGPLFLRVRGQGSTEVSNEIVAGCLAPPPPPTALTTTLSGTTLTLAWLAPFDAVTSYVLSAGTASGLSDAVTTTLPGAPTSISGTVPGGTFFARVQASNACGTSGPSGEVFFTIGAPDPLPAAPANAAASVNGSTVTLTWTAPAGPVTGYVLEGGTARGLADIGAIQVGPITSFAIPGALPGVYYVRVRAITSAGLGAASNDAVVVVP